MPVRSAILPGVTHQPTTLTLPEEAAAVVELAAVPAGLCSWKVLSSAAIA
jgi:hypothetical protein